MRDPIRAAGVVAMLAFAVQVGAAEDRPLAGRYRIAGKTLVDAPPDEPRDTHLHLLITGPAARELYAAMKVKPRRDACEPSAWVKSIGDMQCRREAERHECAFAVDIARQRIAAASVC